MVDLAEIIYMYDELVPLSLYIWFSIKCNTLFWFWKSSGFWKSTKGIIKSCCLENLFKRFIVFYPKTTKIYLLIWDFKLTEEEIWKRIVRQTRKSTKYKIYYQQLHNRSLLLLCLLYTLKIVLYIFSIVIAVVIVMVDFIH